MTKTFSICSGDGGISYGGYQTWEHAHRVAKELANEKGIEFTIAGPDDDGDTAEWTVTPDE